MGEFHQELRKELLDSATYQVELCTKEIQSGLELKQELTKAQNKFIH